MTFEVNGKVGLIQDLGEGNLHGLVGLYASLVLSLFFEGKLVNLCLVDHQQRKRLHNEMLTFSS